MRIIEEPDDSVSVYQMQDGDIAVIIKWDTDPDPDCPYIGRIVQKFGESLLTLGQSQSSGRHWTNFFVIEEPKDHLRYRVRILKKGSIYKIKI